LIRHLLDPKIPVQRAVLQRLGQVFRFKIFRPFEIGDCAGNFENPNNSLRNVGNT